MGSDLIRTFDFDFVTKYFLSQGSIKWKIFVLKNTENHGNGQ